MWASNQDLIAFFWLVIGDWFSESSDWISLLWQRKPVTMWPGPWAFFSSAPWCTVSEWVPKKDSANFESDAFL